MEILGIGASELFFIVLIAIIVLGPKDMQKAGKTVGRWLNQFIRSDGWKALQRASKEIRNLPTNLMREANMEEVQQIGQDIRNSIDPRRPATPNTSRKVTPPGGEVASPQPPTDHHETPTPPETGTDAEQK
jgi:sec-independent protein translocase protein TatB